MTDSKSLRVANDRLIEFDERIFELNEKRAGSISANPHHCTTTRLELTYSSMTLPLGFLILNLPKFIGGT